MPTPTTGFFEVIAESVNLTGSNTWIFTGAADMKGVFNNITENIGIQAQKDVPSNYNIQFGAKAFPDTANIILNRGTADEEILTFAGLPSGFTVAYLELRIFILFSTLNPMKFLYNDVPVGDYLPLTNGLQQFSISPTPSLTETFFATNWGFDCDGTDGVGSSGTPIIRNCYKWGTYEIHSYTWTLNKTHARAGDTVQITSTGDPDTGPDLTDVTDIHLTYTDPVEGPKDIVIATDEFLTWTVFVIIFELPDDIPPDVEVTIKPTIFGGSVTLGTLTIVIANASGIYRLVANQNYDTLYISNPTINDTEQVKIPDPYFRTGYIGG